MPLSSATPDQPPSAADPPRVDESSSAGSASRSRKPDPSLPCRAGGSISTSTGYEAEPVKLGYGDAARVSYAVRWTV